MPNDTTDESTKKRRQSLVNDCINDETLPEESASDVRQAMRRVSIMATTTTTTTVPQDLKNIPETVAEKLKSMLVTIRSTDHGVWLGESDKQEERALAFQTLSSLPPFSYLPSNQQRDLVMDLRMFCYKDGDVIIEQDKNENHVFVTARGRIMLVVLQNKQHPQQSTTRRQDGLSSHPLHSSFKFLGYLDAPAVVGEYECIFETPRTAQVVAGGNNVVAYRMSGDTFRQLLQNPAFKLKMACSIQNKGLFKDISSFVALVRREALAEQQMDFDAILQQYRNMTPAIHARLHSSSLDMEGWTYAIRRLPDTVTCTHVYLLSNAVPLPFMNENFDLAQVSVPSASRRRLAFCVNHGKLLVIMREKFSDVLDFLSLLCAHVHESHKLRLKLNKPTAFDVIHACLWSPERKVQHDETEGLSASSFYRRQMYTAVSIEEQRQALEKLPLSKEEIQGLESIWPNDFLYRIWDMIAMHENIQVRGDFSASYIEASDRWAEHIRRAVTDLLQNGDSEKEICVCTDLTTHIISSNTTSVRNLLSPYIRKNATVIRKWGIEAHPEIEDEQGLSESDKLCALCTAYMKAHPEAQREQDDFDASCIKTLRHTELTGIQVELIDIDSLYEAYAKHDIKADSYLAPFIGKGDSGPKRRRLLVNIDYAFGKQAEQLISSICLLFGESIASVGVMGKAGGLVGKRGDIVVADYLIHQEDDEMTLVNNNGVDRDALAALSSRKVWSGGVLTVFGTLLQDNRILQYYKKLAGCVSLEMEGSYYAREVLGFKKAKLLAEETQMRFLYYFSDTPLSLDPSETLSKDLAISEVIPPQYAVTRELLRLVLVDKK
jgi:CRP-like cAMP-binding protein